MTESSLPQVTLRRMSITAEYEIAASAARVWQALTTEQSAWWGAPYLCCDDSVEIRLDLRAGGALLELGADGTQVLWGTVSGFTPDEYLEFEGNCGMRWPAIGNWSYRLEARGDGCLLSIRHEAIGPFDDSVQENYGKGWNDLMNIRLRGWVEQGQRQGIGNEPEWARQNAADAEVA